MQDFPHDCGMVDTYDFYHVSLMYGEKLILLSTLYLTDVSDK